MYFFGLLISYFKLIHYELDRFVFLFSSLAECLQTVSFGSGFMMDVSLALLPGSRGKLRLLLHVDLQYCPSLSNVKISFCALNMSWGMLHYSHLDCSCILLLDAMNRLSHLSASCVHVNEEDNFISCSSSARLWGR